MLWENEMLQQKAVMLGGFICYCTSTSFSSLPFFLFLLFWGRDLLSPSLLSFPSSLLWFLFLYFFPFSLPLFFPFWITYGYIGKHTYVIIAIICIMTYQLQSVFKYIFFFHLDGETTMWNEWGLSTDRYFTDFKKGPEKLNSWPKVG